LGRVNHWVVAHGRCPWRGKGIAHRGTRTAGVIGHCIAAAGVTGCNARSRYAGRGGLGMEAGVGKWTRVHEASSQRRRCRRPLMRRSMRRLVGHSAALLIAARRGSCDASVVALVAHNARMCALGADRVQEGEKDTLLHELVDLGNSLV
jgi:hypothetical protein